MSISKQVDRDLLEAMKARDRRRLDVLRMMKTALKNKQIEKRAELEDQEAVQVLVTLIKQRRDSIEQFTKGGRPDLARGEAAEIPVIEAYMPKAVSEEEIAHTVRQIIGEMGSATLKDMGAVIKATMARFQSSGGRAEGKTVSEVVKRELSDVARS